MQLDCEREVREKSKSDDLIKRVNVITSSEKSKSDNLKSKGITYTATLTSNISKRVCTLYCSAIVSAARERQKATPGGERERAHILRP